MRQKRENQKTELIERIAKMAQEQLGEGKSAKGKATVKPSLKAADAEAFIRLFYKNVPADDMLSNDALNLFGAAMALWRFAETRAPGTPKIRAYNPRFEENGWHTTHTVIEIVNDDMPFLVDSVTGELNRRELGVHLVIHPVATVVRGADGKRQKLVPAKTEEAGVVAESVMQIHISARSAPEVLAGIETGLAAVLADVRAAVADWRTMRRKLLDVVAEVESNPPPLPKPEIDEALAFLRWLEADHFTFLGFREFTYEGKGKDARMAVVEGSGLGILRDPKVSVFGGVRAVGALPDAVRQEIERPNLLVIAKGNKVSTVHRNVHLDSVAVKKIDAEGKVAGQWQVTGLFTSVAYNESPRSIPLLRRKISETVARAGFSPSSHDGKELITILESYPRDELWQIELDQLFDIATGILDLQERQQIALFLRPDTFRRFISCLVYVPRDAYNTDLRMRFQAILEDSLSGKVTAFYTQMTESVLARLHFIVQTGQGTFPELDARLVEERLVEAARSWHDHLRQSLIEAKGEELGLRLFERYADAFPAAYRERFPGQVALPDIERVDEVVTGGQLSMNLYNPIDAEEGDVSFKIFNPAQPVPLSDVLPMLENLGLRVISETPYFVRPKGESKGADDTRSVWIQDFSMRLKSGGAIAVAKVKQSFHDAFRRVWNGEAEDDGFNRLVLGAGLAWRDVVVLRAYAKYVRQTGFTFSQSYIEDTLAEHPEIARLLIRLFDARFDHRQKDGPAGAKGIAVEIEQALDAVTNLDQDRILRRFVNLIQSTLRTNHFQSGADGQPKPYVSFKLDSQKVDDLPLPRPLVEIWVYSPKVEAVHLRGGRVARGGIRWSDRREDFRTEILGLMKAQMVKNSVIVPVGSKGGFFVKRPPAEGGRDALMAEVVRCYQTMMRGMLDLTDNATVKGIAPPKEVVRLDQDDPYLVVAADKGTATFSDIANGVSREYGFWLDDAFASGGSAGYDHKKMAITARGAWESVKRHFREIGVDIQTTPFACVGVGDMAGDVFGNGLLRSRATKLVAAFNHMHIFIDPSPDPEASFKERERMFNLPRSTWADYDAKLISKGGGVFERKAKSIKLSPEAKKLLGLDRDTLTPAEIVLAILKAEVDLLFFGGIGTFVKASHETHGDAGDRANDSVRVDAKDIRAKVIGEGANLGMTQQARIEFGLKGGRINTDAIDNSAGVDCSDHEVNIKILTGDIVGNGDMTVKQRDALLASMTENVATLVLQDNIDQSLALSLAEADGAAGVEELSRLMRALERIGLLNRAIEYLPSNTKLTERVAAGRSLTRPEVAVLLAYAKMALYNQVLPSNLPDDATLKRDLEAYFPEALRQRFAKEIGRHKLKREIVGTVVVNQLINRTGPGFVNAMAEKTGREPADIARAYLVARDAFDLGSLWEQVQSLGMKTPAATQYRLHRDIKRLTERAALWLLTHGKQPLDIALNLNELAPGIRRLSEGLAQALPEADRVDYMARTAELTSAGAPADLAGAVAALDWLAAAPDIVRLVGPDGAERVIEVARTYYSLGRRLGIDWLRQAAGQLPAESAWARQAVSAVTDDLLAHQSNLTRRVLADGNGKVGDGVLDSWIATRTGAIERIDQLLGELKAASAVDLAMLAVANRRFGELVAA
jgi:glutamate dehydrogenase